MKESLVQWTLLNNLEFLSKALDFPISAKKGQEISTEFGRIDFVVENARKQQLIVELETVLDNSKKVEYCFTQILSYKNVRFAAVTDYCLLYAVESPERSKLRITDFANQNDILARTYSLNEVKSLYNTTVERLSLSFGLALPKPANYTISYLRWLNKILKPFRDLDKRQLDENEIASYFTSPKSTNFRCYLRLALDFEMIALKEGKYELSEEGYEYINSFNPEIDFTSELSTVNLTNEQKKILLRVITNGKWTTHKVNVYWFLRFLEVTNGEWIPRTKKFEEHKLELANGLFGVNYKARTMYEYLNFAANWCMELGLVEKIVTGTEYDRVFLTPLGVEINNIFGLDLQLKKSRFNLGFKYLD